VLLLGANRVDLRENMNCRWLCVCCCFHSKRYVVMSNPHKHSKNVAFVKIQSYLGEFDSVRDTHGRFRIVFHYMWENGKGGKENGRKSMSLNYNISKGRFQVWTLRLKQLKSSRCRLILSRKVPLKGRIKWKREWGKCRKK
jgi:hypothetical protein